MNRFRAWFVPPLMMGAWSATVMACGNSSTTVDGGTDAAVEGGSTFDGAGAPFLTQLAVTSTASGMGSLTLQPSFYPGTYDYYVRCGPGGNPLSVAMTANTGSNSQLLLPTRSASKPSQTVSVAAQEGAVLEAVATKGSQTTSYWVRCLPADFPMLQFTLHADAGAVSPGYYLIGNAQFASSANYAFILDTHGVPVWYHLATDDTQVVDVDSLAKNEVSYILNWTPPAAPQDFEVIDLPATAPKTVAATDFTTDIHDLRVTPGGNYAIISYVPVSGVDLSSLSITETDGGTIPLGKDATILDCKVVEFDASGTPVHQWDASSHLDPAKSNTFMDSTFVVKYADGTVAYDVYHCNSLDIDPANGNYLLSGRSMDSVFYVERATGNVLWKLGGHPSSLDAATKYVTFASAKDTFLREHDGRLVAGWQQGCNGGTGQVSVFDDETSSSPVLGARGMIYDVVVGGPSTGECVGPAPKRAISGEAVLANAYPISNDHPSELGGSVRIFSDETRLVGWGFNLNGLIFSEYDLAGRDLLDFDMPPVWASYRAVKVPVGEFDSNLLHQSLAK